MKICEVKKTLLYLHFGFYFHMTSPTVNEKREQMAYVVLFLTPHLLLLHTGRMRAFRSPASSSCGVFLLIWKQSEPGAAGVPACPRTPLHAVM